jgi:DNA polymerase-3 subunit delta'
LNGNRSDPSYPWGLLGNEWAVQLLQEHIASGTVRQAYLFSGPQGIGRRTLALRLAQAINCPTPIAVGEPCLTCRTCTLIEGMQHPDLTVLQAEEIGGNLKVDQVRELQRSLSLAPYEAKQRMALLLRFEDANPSAANALLKTLEEPPPHVVMMITAESSERLLPTIVSRCEVLRLHPVPLGVLERWLKTRWGVPPEEARRLAHLSGGRPGFAVQRYQSPEKVILRESWLDDQNDLLTASRVERFAYAEMLVKDKEILYGTLQAWLSFWRDVLMAASGASVPLTNLSREEEVARLAEVLDLAGAFHLVTRLERTFDLLEQNVNARLAVEVFMLELPFLETL